MGESAPPGDGSDPEDVSGFYDSIADDYHLAGNYEDWRETVEVQAENLESIIGKRLAKTPPWRVLDCSCGIGTQAIGLALRGHRVTGTDLSPRAVERARREAASLSVQATFAVADMRRLDVEVGGEYDVVLSCDNSLAHLDGDDLSCGLRAMMSKLMPKGVVLVSIRDYDALVTERPRVPSLPRVHDTRAGRRVIFQLWDWEPDASGYLMTWLFLHEGRDGFETSQHTTRLHAHRRSELTKAFVGVGLVEPEWHLPDDVPGFYQPVLTAVRADHIPGV